MDTQNTTRIYCNFCKQITNHNLLCQTKIIRFEIEDVFLDFVQKMSVYQCAGCNTLVCEYIRYVEDDPGGAYLTHKNTIEYLPLRTDGEYPPIKDIDLLPVNIKIIYLESISNYNIKHLFSCAIGIRAIIESVLKNKGISNDELSQMIDKAKQRGIITSAISTLLHSQKNLGNDVIHELYFGKQSEVYNSLVALDLFLQHIYKIPDLSEKLKSFDRTIKKE